MIERSQVRVPAGAAGEVSSPGLISSSTGADYITYFERRLTPLCVHSTDAELEYSCSDADETCDSRSRHPSSQNLLQAVTRIRTNKNIRITTEL